MFILEIQWDAGQKPGLVGPFDSRSEAFNWARKNVDAGSYCARPVVTPEEIPHVGL